MSDAFSDLFSQRPDQGAAAFAMPSGPSTHRRPGAGGSQYQKKRKSRVDIPAALQSLFVFPGSDSDDSDGERGSSKAKSKNSRKRKRPDDDDESSLVEPRKKQRKTASKMSPADMAKFMFSQYYVVGANKWITLQGRSDVRMENPRKGEILERGKNPRAFWKKGPGAGGGAVGGGGGGGSVRSFSINPGEKQVPPSRPSQRASSDDTEEPMRDTTSTELPELRGPLVECQEQLQRYLTMYTEDPEQSLPGLDKGQFSSSFHYDRNVAYKTFHGLSTISPQQITANSQKPLWFNAVMHPVHEQELMGRMARFAKDSYAPERQDCPICVYGACDRQAALGGSSMGTNSAVSNFFVMYAHDRENVNEHILYRSLSSYWNRYIYAPGKKVKRNNGCEIRPSHVEYHFNYCMECSNPVAMISKELRNTDMLLKTMREQGLYMEAMTHGNSTGRVYVSPLVARQVQMQSMHKMNLALRLQGVSWNEKTLARLSARVSERDFSNLNFDSGQASYSAALNQYGKAIVKNKALNAGSLL